MDHHIVTEPLRTQNVTIAGHITWAHITWHRIASRDMTQHKQSHRIKWHDHHIKWHDMHQNRSHHHHGTAKGRFTAKKWFGHRAGRSPCAHSIGKLFLCYIVLFSSETSAPGSPGNYLYWHYIDNRPLKLQSPLLKFRCSAKTRCNYETCSKCFFRKSKDIVKCSVFFFVSLHFVNANDTWNHAIARRCLHDLSRRTEEPPRYIPPSKDCILQIPRPIHHVGQGSPILQRNHCITVVPPKWGPYKLSIRVHAPTIKLNYLGQHFGGTWHESPVNKITNLTTKWMCHDVPRVWGCFGLGPQQVYREAPCNTSMWRSKQPFKQLIASSILQTHWCGKWLPQQWQAMCLIQPQCGKVWGNPSV